jgi:hypothetical protein
MKAIEVDNLTKIFGHFVVVGHVSKERSPLTCLEMPKLLTSV